MAEKKPKNFAEIKYKGIYFIFNSSQDINLKINTMQDSGNYSVDQLFDYLTKKTKILFVSADRSHFVNYKNKIVKNG